GEVVQFRRLLDRAQVGDDLLREPSSELRKLEHVVTLAGEEHPLAVEGHGLPRGVVQHAAFARIAAPHLGVALAVLAVATRHEDGGERDRSPERSEDRDARTEFHPRSSAAASAW